VVLKGYVWRMFHLKGMSTHVAFKGYVWRMLHLKGMSDAGCRKRVPGPVPGRPQPGQDPSGAALQCGRRQVRRGLCAGGRRGLQGGVLGEQQQVTDCLKSRQLFIASLWTRCNGAPPSLTNNKFRIRHTDLLSNELTAICRRERVLMLGGEVTIDL